MRSVWGLPSKKQTVSISLSDEQKQEINNFFLFKFVGATPLSEDCKKAIKVALGAHTVKLNTEYKAHTGQDKPVNLRDEFISYLSGKGEEKLEKNISDTALVRRAWEKCSKSGCDNNVWVKQILKNEIKTAIAAVAQRPGEEKGDINKQAVGLKNKL